jgi:hypothetical protein
VDVVEGQRTSVEQQHRASGLNLVVAATVERRFRVVCSRG